MRMIIVSMIALVLGMISAVAGEGADRKGETWSPRSDIRGDGVYSLEQCERIVRLRRAGICHRPDWR
jgi:hypothetical protein